MSLKLVVSHLVWHRTARVGNACYYISEATLIKTMCLIKDEL